MDPMGIMTYYDILWHIMTYLDIAIPRFFSSKALLSWRNKSKWLNIVAMAWSNIAMEIRWPWPQPNRDDVSIEKADFP